MSGQPPIQTDSLPREGEHIFRGNSDEAPTRVPIFDKDGNGTLNREEYIKGGKK